MVVHAGWLLVCHRPRGVTCTIEQAVGDGGRERRGVAVGPALAQQPAQLDAGAGPLLHQRPAGGDHLVDVEADQVAPEGAAGGERPVEHRLHQRPQAQAVARR